MRYPRSLLLTSSALAALASCPALIQAHGFVGDRFFPATVTTDDPLATDELALPTLSLFTNPAEEDAPETRTITAGFEFDKLILPQLALGISDQHLWQTPRPSQNAKAADGWDNLTLSLKYELYRNEPHEFIFSLGLETDLGGTGSKSIGRESFTTFTPTLYFGKGLGDLPDSLAPFQPLAVTGTLGLTLPTEAADPNALAWGLAIEYNLPYLQQHIQDLGLPEPLRSMIPLVEFSGQSPLNRNPGLTTGTINPGILWESKYFQVGVEALIPINRDSGDHIGAIVQVQIYIDDLFPTVFGHPIFGDSK